MHYNASKAGMEGLTRGYAARLVKEGITVNAVAPSLIDTDMMNARRDQYVSRIPLGRMGSRGGRAGGAADDRQRIHDRSDDPAQRWDEFHLRRSVLALQALKAHRLDRRAATTDLVHRLDEPPQ